jgi:hypothetical protein
MSLLVDVVAGTSPAAVDELLIDLRMIRPGSASHDYPEKGGVCLGSSYSRRHLRCDH